jgi:hypothetical protein
MLKVHLLERKGQMEGLDWKRGFLGIYALCWAYLILLAFVALFAKPQSPADGIAVLAITVAGPALLLLIIRDLDH